MLGKMKAGGEGVTEDRMVGWHHRLSGHGFKQTLGDGEGQKTWRAAVYGVTKSQIQLRTEHNRLALREKQHPLC